MLSLTPLRSLYIFKAWCIGMGTTFTVYIDAQLPLVGQGFLIIEASRPHSDTPHSLGLLWTNDQLDAEISA